MSLLSAFITWLGRWQKPAASSAPPLAQVLAHEGQGFAETLARIAESQVGKHEVGGNNLGADVVEYQKATWLTPAAWPWCAAFVCWCVFQAIKALAMAPAWPRPRTAGAYDLEAWANGKYGKMLNAFRVFSSNPKDPATWPRRGDILTFTWSHCGICTGYDVAARRVQTVEGNAGLDLTSDTTTGDGVVAKNQHIKNIRRLIRYVG